MIVSMLVRWSLSLMEGSTRCDNVWHNEIPVVNWEKGGIIEEEVSIGFTPSDLQNLDAVA